MSRGAALDLDDIPFRADSVGVPDSGGVRVGPLTPAQQSLIEESRSILARPDAKLGTRPENETVRTCPLVSVETTTTRDGGVFRLCAVGDESPGTRWYGYSGGRGGTLVPIENRTVADRHAASVP
jgi:hypothetical protein